MWDLPGPGLESMSPALAGGFSTTAPPGKPQGHAKFVFSKTADQNAWDEPQLSVLQPNSIQNPPASPYLLFPP